MKNDIALEDAEIKNRFEIRLKNDLFPKFVNVLNGFATVPPVDEVEIEFD